MQTQEFVASQVNQTLDSTLTRFQRVVTHTESPKLEKLCEKTSGEVKKHLESDTLSIAFVGQYSAGKSTIVSALTGRRDINIDTDIATDETAKYEWNGVELIDTPGLFTERGDHDDITYEAIERADLLIFVVTYMLFDSVTIENFKKLAYDLNYRDKMLLVVNKMSDEAGEFDNRVSNYRQSLADALVPRKLDDFPIAFIDALDYVDGTDEEDDFFINESHFPQFIDQLNTFASQRGAIAHLDTPIRILLGSIGEAIHELSRDDSSDQVYLEVLNRCRRLVREHRRRFRRNSNQRVTRLTVDIEEKSADLVQELGGLSEDEFKGRLKSLENNIEERMQEAAADFETSANDAAEELRTEMSDILSSDLVKAYMASVDVDVEVDDSTIGEGYGDETIQRIRRLKGVARFTKSGLGNISKKASDAVSGASSSKFLSAGQVAQSSAHDIVYGVGKALGVKFKPWQAVNLAKKVGNFAKVAGPILSLAGVALDAYGEHKDEERAKELAEAKRTLIRQFRSVAEQIEKRFDEERVACEKVLFDPIKDHIVELITDERASISSANEHVQELEGIQSELRRTLQTIHRG